MRRRAKGLFLRRFARGGREFSASNKAFCSVEINGIRFARAFERLAQHLVS